MNRNNAPYLILIIALGLLLAYEKGCNSGEVVKSDEAWQHRIDSIMNQINWRDTILISRDSVVYRTAVLRETLRDYRLIHDTLQKIILCDSIVIACDSLASQFNRQDSIYREQIHDYSTIVANQDSVIFDQSGQIKKLKLRNKILVSLAAILSVVAAVK